MSNVLEFETRVSVQQRAREWLIRLDGDDPLTDTERHDLRAWMSQNPSHREELTRLAKYWDQANVLTELAVPLRRTATQQVAVKRSRNSVGLPVAGALVASALVLLWLLYPVGAANGAYGTVIGQQRTISLRDGSSIKLNTDTQVQVDYEDAVRRVRLLHGEALFSVAHDADRPFKVYAAEAIVKAVGTAFAVELVGQDVHVTVTKGIVDVIDVGPTLGIAGSGAATKREPIAREVGRFEAGQTATLESSSREHVDVEQLPPPELARRLAWQDGYLVFSGEPLSEVVRQVNRYSSVTLEVTDPKIASIAIGGRFKIGDLDAVLAALRSNFGIDSVQIGAHDVQLESARPH